MRDSERYMAQAQAVLRMAARAGSPAERQVYETIAQGWTKLATEARRNEGRAPEDRPEADLQPFREASAG